MITVNENPKGWASWHDYTQERIESANKLFETSEFKDAEKAETLLINTKEYKEYFISLTGVSENSFEKYKEGDDLLLYSSIIKNPTTIRQLYAEQLDNRIKNHDNN